MKIILYLAVVVVVLLQTHVELPEAAPASQQRQQQQQPDYWAQRKAEFYRNTSFELSEDNVRLMGGKFCKIHQVHLPFWFDFELFKVAFKKSYPSAAEELTRHRIYVNSCVRTLRERVMYRILASNENPSITSEADLSFVERIPTEAPSRTINPLEPAGIEFSAELELDLDQNSNSNSDPDADAAGELPLERAVRLVRAELERVESRNQLENYLKAFGEAEAAVIDAQLPY